MPCILADHRPADRLDYPGSLQNPLFLGFLPCSRPMIRRCLYQSHAATYAARASSFPSRPTSASCFSPAGVCSDAALTSEHVVTVSVEGKPLSAISASWPEGFHIAACQLRWILDNSLLLLSSAPAPVYLNTMSRCCSNVS